MCTLPSLLPSLTPPQCPCRPSHLQLLLRSPISLTRLHSGPSQTKRRIYRPLPQLNIFLLKIYIVYLNILPNRLQMPPSNSDRAGTALPAAPQSPHPHICDIRPPPPPVQPSCVMLFWSIMFNLSHYFIKQFTLFQKTFDYEDSPLQSNRYCRLLYTDQIR